MNCLMTCRWLLAFVSLTFVFSRSLSAVEYPGTDPGPATVTVHPDRIEFANQVLAGSWGRSGSGLQNATVRDPQSGVTWETTRDLFQVVLTDGTTYASSSLKLVGEVSLRSLAPETKSARLAEQFAGQAVEVGMVSADERLRVVWRAILLDGANYVRQELELTAPQDPLTIREIVWLDEIIADAVNAGSVDGSLVTIGPFFLGCEDPMAENRVVAPAPNEGTQGGVVKCRLVRNTDLQPGETLTQSFVIGVAPQDQLRRAFLYYLERERAHPYRPFLHYNSWYDIAWQPFALNEENCLEAIRLFGERLIRRHGVVMDAMVFDDGWDNPRTLWQFHTGFPRGFTPLADLCREYDTRLGVWLSPFGGYGEPREQRLAFGREQGFETNATGFSLAGPKYYQAFRQACVNMIRQFGVNHFKFDGIAQGMSAQGAGEYVRDTECMRRLMLELRREDPRLYINLTTGSWPSPFWLRYADSLWRQGGDMGWAGVGSKQQQWLTYRDQEIYRNIVCRGPLYPLNALMTQGVAYSRQGSAGEPSFTAEGFRDDVHAFFGSGTGLQELYIQPAKLTDEDWIVLAEAAKWSRANTDVLVDTHWIGGDPSKLEVYGFASWSPRKGIVMLRNPDEQPHTFALDIGTAFELPPGACRVFSLRSAWAADAGQPELAAQAGQAISVALRPFEVLVLDAMPQDSPADEAFRRLFPEDGVPKG
ncbi:MAG: alpha-amylase family protein [Pirellulaceae bacterium]